MDLVKHNFLLYVARFKFSDSIRRNFLLVMHYSNIACEPPRYFGGVWAGGLGRTKWRRGGIRDFMIHDAAARRGLQNKIIICARQSDWSLLEVIKQV